MNGEDFFATSPDRFGFLIGNEKSRPRPSQAILAFYERCKDEGSKPADTAADMENDMRRSRLISEKCKHSESYSQNLYAALCNNSFSKDGEEWSCSWRHSGGIVADLREQGDYIDWYCSGIRDGDGVVSEGQITDEVRSDLASLGWFCL